MSIWSQLNLCSEKLNDPFVERNVFKSLPIEEVELLETFRRVSEKQKGCLTSTLEVNQNGRNLELEYQMLDTPPDASDSLHSWFTKNFSSKPTAVILKRVECWSASIANLAAEFNYSLANGDLSQLYHLECVLFLGNYDFTPYGVHIDHGINSVIHIPISGEPKSLYLWEAKTFEDVTGSKKPCFKPNSILPHAQCYKFQPGDIFCLPSSKFYHVGQSPTLTFDLTFVIKPYQQRSPLEKLQESLQVNFGSAWQNCDNVRKLSLDQAINLAENHHKLRHVSNLGLSTCLKYHGALTLPSPDQLFQVVPPFQIHYIYRDSLIVYVRGSTFSLEEWHVSEMCELFDILNTGEPTSLRQAHQLLNSLEFDELESIIRLLFRCHILRLCHT